MMTPLLRMAPSSSRSMMRPLECVSIRLHSKHTQRKQFNSIQHSNELDGLPAGLLAGRRSGEQTVLNIEAISLAIGCLSSNCQWLADGGQRIDFKVKCCNGPRATTTSVPAARVYNSRTFTTTTMTKQRSNDEAAAPIGRQQLDQRKRESAKWMSEISLPSHFESSIRSLGAGLGGRATSSCAKSNGPTMKRMLKSIWRPILGA